jgi:hypothetical protein
LTRSRRPRPRPTNPCAAVSCLTNTSCEVIDGQPVCVPLDPEPSGRFCGGFAGIACPGAGSCVDDPSDDCDPERGGADCGGLCECNALALCVGGTVFDASPDVCACVPAEPAPDACAGVRCRAGTHCEVVGGDAAACVADEAPNPCAAVLCPAPSTCDVVNGEAVCTPIEQPNPCAAVLCPAPSTCDVVDGKAVCTPIAPTFCGGIAAFPCPGSGSCVDNPADDCDPRRGGADCGGICECNVLALCIEGFTFDPSPAVCACVPASGSGQECSAAAH